MSSFSITSAHNISEASKKRSTFGEQKLGRSEGNGSKGFPRVRNNYYHLIKALSFWILKGPQWSPSELFQGFVCKRLGVPFSGWISFDKRRQQKSFWFPVNCIKPSPFLSTQNFSFLSSAVVVVASFKLHEQFQERQTTKTTEVLIDILLILSTAKLRSLHRRKFVFCRLFSTRFQREVLIANKSFIRKKCISWSSMMGRIWVKFSLGVGYGWVLENIFYFV